MWRGEEKSMQYLDGLKGNLKKWSRFEDRGVV
jgi:hypothetical protein